jgi:prefoldin subunit 5
MGTKQKDLDSVIGSLRRVMQPVRKKVLSGATLTDSNEALGLLSKYKRLISMLEKSGQKEEVPLLKKQATILRAILEFLEEKEKDQLEEHYISQQKQNAQDIKTINDRLQRSKKVGEAFFKKYAKNAELLRQKIDARIKQLQKQVTEVDAQISEVTKQISDIDEQIINIEKQVHYDEEALVKEFEEEWAEHDLPIPALDFRKFIQDVAHDKNNPIKDRDDLVARAELKLHEIIAEVLRRDLVSEKEALSIIEKTERGLVVLVGGSKISSIAIGIVTRQHLHSARTELGHALEQLAHEKERMQKEIKEKQEDLGEAKQEIQEMKKEVGPSSPEETIRPTPLPTRPRLY